MTGTNKPESLEMALSNLAKAFASLESFLDEEVKSDRDRAGVIQAFEYTFELCWKFLQKMAWAEGLQAASPRQALKAAFQLGLITSEDEEHWLGMLGDRNNTVHTYRAEIAQEIFLRIRDNYRQSIGTLLERAGRMMD